MRYKLVLIPERHHRTTVVETPVQPYAEVQMSWYTRTARLVEIRLQGQDEPMLVYFDNAIPDAECLRLLQVVALHTVLDMLQPEKRRQPREGIDDADRATALLRRVVDETSPRLELEEDLYSEIKKLLEGGEP